MTTTRFTVSTGTNVLIPGDGTHGAESTTTTIDTVSSGGAGISDHTLILLMVAGLCLVGLLVSVLTWRYWVATRARPLAGPTRSTPRNPRSLYPDA